MEKIKDEQIKDFVSKIYFSEEIIFKKNSFFPKISIVTTSFNQKQFIERTILSVLNQNYPNLEYIIIDGGSTDGSISIIKKYEKYLTFWVSEKDRGQSEGLNKGFKRATGEIVGWQNSDDIYLQGSFLKIVNLFKKSLKTDVVYGNRFDIDENENIIRESIFTKFSKIVYQYDGISLGTQSTFWRRELFSKIGYLDTDLHFAMDYEFFLRMATKGARFKFLPYYLGAMRRHRAAKTEMFLGTPPHQKELKKIDKEYGRKKLFNFPLKIYSLIFRIVNYSLQGDLKYVFKGLIRRLRNKTLISGR